jgi:hypothetical protein
MQEAASPCAGSLGHVLRRTNATSPPARVPYTALRRIRSTAVSYLAFTSAILATPNFEPNFEEVIGDPTQDSQQGLLNQLRVKQAHNKNEGWMGAQRMFWLAKWREDEVAAGWSMVPGLTPWGPQTPMASVSVLIGSTNIYCIHRCKLSCSAQPCKQIFAPKKQSARDCYFNLSTKKGMICITAWVQSACSIMFCSKLF